MKLVENSINTCNLMFSKFAIHPWQIFLKSNSSFAFVNLKPFVPGHVLISPIRVTKHVYELSDEEMNDLMILSDIAAHIVKQYTKCETVITAIQDGPLAGQTVPHVHVHLMPKIMGDSETTVPDSQQNERRARTEEEMSEETLALRLIAINLGY